ncbi:helix-turn-helix domain-containing protein [Nonomuraea ferruginea]
MAQVVRLAAQGLSDEAIARHLGVSVRTVRTRFAEAMTELGGRSRGSRRVWRRRGADGSTNDHHGRRPGLMVGRCRKTSPATRSRMIPTTRPRRWAGSATPSR